MAEKEVNWCPKLGTVLANDEIINGLSERGGYAVIKKKMKQWSIRTTAYAERLLDDLDLIDPSVLGEAIKVITEFDASTNVLITGLPADSTGDEYYSDVFTGIPNNAGSGVTGDIQFTTVGHDNTDTYTAVSYTHLTLPTKA